MSTVQPTDPSFDSDSTGGSAHQSFDSAHANVSEGAAVVVTDTTRSRYRSRRWWTPTSGVRLPVDNRSLGDMCDALLLVVPDATFSGATAAQLWGLPIPTPLKDIIEITVPDAHVEIRRPGVRCRRRDIPSHSIKVKDSRPVIAPARVFVDLARDLDRAWLVAVGDAALRLGLIDKASIVRALAETRGHRGIRRAREALSMLDARAESPRESITRVRLVDAGILGLVSQYVVTDADGAFVARVDLALVDQRIAIEYDGGHHLTVDQQAKDAVRRQQLEMNGWLIVTVNSRDLHEPHRLERRVRAALTSRRA